MTEILTAIDEILSSLTPESVEQTIREIASEDRYAERDTIAVGLIADRILKKHGLGSGAADSLAHAKLAQKIVAEVALIEGMRYFEND